MVWLVFLHGVSWQYNLVEGLAEMEEHDIKVERDIIFREVVEVAITIEADENEESNDIY